MLCVDKSAGGLALLKHALQHIPKEITEKMLRQQSKEGRDTVSEANYMSNSCDAYELPSAFAYCCKEY